jgi:predicted transcriptional regulator
MAKLLNKIKNLSYNLGPLLHNRIILYFFTAVALFELLYFLTINDMFAFSTLILIGILTSFFNKNMTVILFIAIIFTHILKYGRSSYSEGMDNKDEDVDKKLSSTESSDQVVDELSKIKNLSEKINKIADTKDDKKNDLIEHLQDIKETRDKIIENVQNMQPLLNKFEGYVEKFKEYKNSQGN